MDELFTGQTNKRVIYSPTIFAKRNLIHLQEIGELSSTRPHISQREKLSSYLFLIVNEGTGTVWYEGNKYEINKGDCFFVDCMKKYAHRCNNWKISWVHFNGNGMAGIYEKYMERTGRPVFQAKTEKSIKEILDQIYTISLTEDPIKDMRINEKLSSLLTDIMSQSLRPLTTYNNVKRITRIKDYLDENYTHQINLDNIAAVFQINKFVMEKEFKKEYGIAIIEYIIRERITKAKELLRFSDNSIESIGREVGIGEPYYFSRLFKKIEGISPREFRKQWN